MVTRKPLNQGVNSWQRSSAVILLFLCSVVLFSSGCGGVTHVSSPGTTTPSISSLNPSSGVVGTPVTITGSSFGSSQGTSTVRFNGTAATPTRSGERRVGEQGRARGTPEQ